VSESVTSIQINVDASRAKAGLDDLRRSIQGTARDLQSLGKSSGGSSFADLSRGLSGVGSGLDNLKRQTRDTGLSNLSREISMLSRGMPVAAREIVALASSFVVSRNAVALFAGALGSVGVAKLASEVQTTGNALLAFRIGIDSVATSSKESGDALEFIRNAATRIGAPLDSATDSFSKLYVNMRSLGRNTDEIKRVFSGFQTALTSLHVSSADQKLFWREVAETYSQGVIHTRQAILSAGSHLPGMASLLQQALGVNGEGLHSMFKSGGLPLDTWTKAADILQQRYGSQLPEAFRHSQQNIVALQNSLTKLQQVVFDSGFDSGLTMFLKTLQGGLNSIGVDDLGAKIGEAFRVGFTAASLFTQKVIELREPIATVAKGLAAYAVASTGIRLAAGAVTLFLSPLGALAALTALASSEWLNLSGVFSGSDAAFNSGAERIRKLTNGFIDLHKSMKGAVELWELAKGLFDGKSWAESKGLAATAGAQFDAGEYGRTKGKEFGDGFTSTAATLFGKLGATLKSALPSFDMASFNKEWDKLYAQTTPSPFHGMGDYSGNAAHYASQTNNDLTESLKKVYERLSPANKGLLEYKENLQAIAKMHGKLSPITGKPIDDSEINDLTKSAREKALTEGFPVASHIQAMMDSVRLEQEALKNLNGNTSAEAMRQEKEFLTFKESMLKKHISLTGEEEQAIRSLIAAQAQLQKGGEDGFSQWANSQKSAMDSLNSDIHSGLDAISNGISKIVVDGKGKFKNLGEAIRAELHDILRGIASNLIKTGVNSLMTEAIKQMSPALTQAFGNGSSSTIAKALGLGQGVLDRANGSLDEVAKNLASTVTPSMSVDAGVVYLNGGIGGASGLTAFKPSSDITRAVNPSAVGGIVPNNATAPLFKNDNLLPEFKANARTGGLMGIPAQSAGMFGQGLGARQGLGDVGNALKPIPDLKLSSTDTTRAFGQHLEKIAPVAQQAGITPISNSLAEMYKRSGLSASTIANMQGVHPDLQRAILKAKELSGAQFTVNHGQGLRSQAEANLNAARGLGIRNSQHIEGTALDVNLYRGGKYVSNGGDPIYSQFNDSVQQAAKEYGLPIRWGGDFKDFDHWQLPRGWKGSHKQADVSPDLGKQLNDQTAKTTQELQKQLTAQRSLATETQKSFSALAKTTQPLGQFDSGVAKIGETMSQGIQPAESFTSEIEKLLSKLASGLGGSGGGLLSGAESIIGGLFSDGGEVTNPTQTGVFPASMWHGAKHYSNGGAVGDGIPIIAHPGEIVLNRAQQANVAAGLQGGGDTHTTVNNVAHVHVQARDADSFRRSFGQIQSAAYQTAARLHMRNG